VVFILLLGELVWRCSIDVIKWSEPLPERVRYEVEELDCEDVEKGSKVVRQLDIDEEEEED
jgi:hypothetical protein